MTTQTRVENIMRASRESRNSDIELYIIYCQKSGMNLTPNQMRILRDMPTMDTLTRIRRKLQEQGKYEADEAVNEARYKKFKHIKQNINYDSPEELLESQGYKVHPFGY